MFQLHQPLWLFLTIISTLAATVIEILVTASLATIFSLLTTQNFGTSSSFMNILTKLSDNFGLETSHFLIFTLVLLAISRVFVGAMNSYTSGRYVFETYRSLVNMHLQNLIVANYTQIKSTNISALVGIIDHESKLTANWFHLPVVTLINEILLIGAFILYAGRHIDASFWYIVNGLIILFVQGTLLVYYQSTFTVERKDLDRLVLKYLDRFLNNLGNIRLASDINVFISPLIEKINLRKKSWIAQQGFGNLLKLVVETPVILLVAFLAFDVRDKSSGISVEMIAFMLLAFMRIAPSMAKVLTSLSQMYYCFKNYSTDKIAELGVKGYTSLVPTQPPVASNAKKILSVRLNNFSSVRNGMKLFKEINCCFSIGNINLILGPSGIGKSTMLECLAGLSKDYFGSIEYIMEDGSIESHLGTGSVDFVFQNSTQYFDDPIKNIIWDSKIDVVKISDVIEKLNLNIIATRTHGTIKTLTNLSDTISGGQNQKLSIARAIYSLKPLLLFDEPSSALDSNSRDLFTEQLSNISQSSIVVIVTHDNYLIDSIGKLSQSIMLEDA